MPETTPLAVRPTTVDLRELDDVTQRLESMAPTQIIEWGHERYGDGLVLAASFQDCVLIDIATSVVPDIEVIFLDTQYHFAETLWYVEEVRRRYDLNLTVVSPLVDPDNRWNVDVDGCCGARKVEPLARALDGRDAWMSGIRRADAPFRATIEVVHWDSTRGLIKLNPLATWTDHDVEGYVRDRELPVNPLVERGYASVGCWPCTDPVLPGDDPRSGRWSGTAKTECGINV